MKNYTRNKGKEFQKEIGRLHPLNFIELKFKEANL